MYLEFFYRQVDTVLALAYGGACFFAFWAFAMHAQSPTRQAATLGFYLLMGLASLTRVLWFATPYGTQSVLMKPPRIMMGDTGWTQFLAAETVELLGSFLLYSVFVLVVVFWADMLRRLFTHDSVRSHPLRLFFSVMSAMVTVQAIGVALFATRRVDSYWVLIYDDVVMCLLSIGSLAAVLVYSFRMKTVLLAFLEVSQIDTTDRIKAVNWATSICAFFLIANTVFLTYSLVSLAHFHQAGVYLEDKSWWLFVASKHLVEIFVLYFLLYTLWGKSSDDAENSKEGYEPIPDGSYLGSEDLSGKNTSGSLASTPRRNR
uniref:THH1/TOM1/TOM3 domain-containing protein n=1 Tax=Hyaloperonospora arabidopsidis (strain Emoy2) TaxID=559515 RepID=M4B2T1_HYAAE